MSPAIAADVPLAGALLASVGDPARTRTVYATILLLVALGFTMILVAAWLVRRTRVDPPVLAPLEKMSDKYWRAVPDPAWQRRVLDEVRPPGAEPLTHAPLAPTTDDDFDLGPRPTSFDDMRDEVAAKPSDDVEPSDHAEPSADAEPSDGGDAGSIERFPAPLPAPRPIAETEPGDDEGDPGEAGEGRSLTSGHGNAGPGRDDRPLP